MRITARGWGLLAAGITLLSTGFAFGYPELALLGATALIALISALGHAALRPRLAVTRVVDPDRVSRGESSTITLTIRNTSRFGAATLLAHDRCGWALNLPDGGRIGGSRSEPTGTVPVPVLRLRHGHDTHVSYPVPTQRRGIVHTGPLQIVRRDPLGLVSTARSHGETSTIWVYPTAHPVQAVPAGISRSLDGRLDRVAHGTITFDALREYVIGDELRHVHWRTSAKVGELMVREHLDTSLPRLVLLLDDRRCGWPGFEGVTCEPFEAACEAAASIITAAVREDLPITLHLVSGAAAGGRIRGSARDLLDLLAEVAPVEQPDEALTTATNRLRQHRPGDTLIYLTGVPGHTDLGLVTRLQGPFPALGVAMLGPRESGEPSASNVLLLRAEDGPEFAAVWDGVSRW